MFIESIEGSWLDHPFWRDGFLLLNQSDLDKLISSNIEAVVIDDAKGVSVANRSSPQSPLRPVNSSNKRPMLHPSHPARIENSLRQCRRAVGQIFAETRMGRSVTSASASRVVTEIMQALNHNPDALMKLTRLKSIDAYTYLHSIAVSALMIGLGRHLKLDDATVQLLGLAGLMHDIGKVTINPAILIKPASLTSEEVAVIRTHPAAGHRILQKNNFPDLVLDVALHHHEKIDGTGYPEHLGSELSAHARIAAICDVYDAMTTLRPYKRAWTPNEALSQMATWKGHFDPAFFNSFVSWLGYEEKAILIPEPTTVAFEENGYSDPVSAERPRGNGIFTN